MISSENVLLYSYSNWEDRFIFHSVIRTRIEGVYY